MTTFNLRSGPDTLATDIVWSSPETNLWVATANGDYAGLVEFVDGHFSVRSSTGSVVAECSSIPAARAALAQHLDTPLSIARSTFSPTAPRSFFNRPRPTYLRDSLAA
jgi:hypothetical protein